MKKTLSLILALVLCLSMCACGKCEHTYEENVSKEATCTDAGTKTLTCSKCNESYTEEIAALGHDYQEADCTNPKTCKTCGATEGTAAGHEWNEATCTVPKTCKTCGVSEGPLAEHSWNDATCTEPKTCSMCGETEGKAIGHEWNDATCTEPKTCKTCGATEGTATGHEWSAATCKAPKTCKVCGKTEGTVGGHSWSAATCTAPKTCKICGTTEGEKGEHDYQDATCTTPKKCKNCGHQSGEALKCTAGDDGTCIRCGKNLLKISDVLSKPMDKIGDIQRIAGIYSYDCYSSGNFRLMFNSANGVILSWGATNTSNKDIKYITFTINYYNSVGDPAYDSVKGKSSYTARLTGPIGAGKSFYLRALIGYGSDIYYGVITSVKIEYMDGSTISGYYGHTTWHEIRTGASPKECFIIEK